MERSQFTFYESFFSAISRIRKKSDRVDAYDAICAYALYGVEPQLDQMPDAAAIAFISARPNLDASRRKASGGRVGGNAKQTESNAEANSKHMGSISEACRKQTASKTEAIASGKQGENASEKENEIEKEKEIENECKESEERNAAGKPPRPPRFTAPSEDDVREYCRSQGYTAVDPERFVSFYQSKGWKVGKEPMKDWRAAVRGWESREKKDKSPLSGGASQRTLDSDELAAIKRMMASEG